MRTVPSAWSRPGLRASRIEYTRFHVARVYGQKRRDFQLLPHWGTPPFRGPLAPRARRAELAIDESRLAARKAEVAASTNAKADQKRKCIVAGRFDDFVRQRSNHTRGWVRATDVDVLE